ncbi:PREDICTED: high affinity copper uptake protein 1 isoform X2 [Ceratosolen solmsi marchali]|uniref:Copper transport protein n=1 Tax=Ceratosolen solmsi marchali TaxID=326594 RepID=A0AAJ6YYB9_9HYME|nr:PREDICTED: high affinity copper uptake protein 1 isoform X2 [Ceratosolen solmsi marchali]
MSHHDHIAHMINTTEGQSIPNVHDIDHSNHVNTNHHLDHNNLNHQYNAQGIFGSTGLCSSASHSIHGMSMAFHGGYCETILFKTWTISSVGGLIGSVIGIVIMAALYEGLKYYREYLFWKTYNALQYRSVSMPPEKAVVNDENRIVQPTMLSWMHGFQTLLHIVQIILSYFLMLIFMTYNTWLCTGVVAGAAIGYFLFGWKKSVIVDVTEHCH